MLVAVLILNALVYFLLFAVGAYDWFKKEAFFATLFVGVMTAINVLGLILVT